MPIVYKSLAEQLEDVIEEIGEDIRTNRDEPIEDLLDRWMTEIRQTIKEVLNVEWTS